MCLIVSIIIIIAYICCYRHCRVASVFVQGSVIILLRNTCLPLAHLPHILTGALETTCRRSAGLVDMNCGHREGQLTSESLFRIVESG